MRGRSFILPFVVILTLVLGSGPSLALAQDEAATEPDLSLVEVAGNDCAWLNAGEEDVVARLDPITCGTLAVPENWPAPGERRLEIEFVILESTGDDPAPDPVVYLAGGPGGSSLNGVPFYAELFAGFREHRDVILYDQRGTGRSSPLRCSSWTIDDLFGLDLSEATGAAAEPATPGVAAGTRRTLIMRGPNNGGKSRLFHQASLPMLPFTWMRRSAVGVRRRLGREVECEMTGLGIGGDVSDASDQTTWDVLATSIAPVTASRSNARALRAYLSGVDLSPNHPARASPGDRVKPLPAAQ